MFFWILPVFRQYKSNLFYYFLILALTDPIVHVCYFYFPFIKGPYIYFVSSLLLYYSIDFSNKKILSNWGRKLILLLILISAFYFNVDYQLILAIIHSLILYKFIKLLTIKFYHEYKLNLFYLVLVLYELTIVIKMSIVLLKTERGDLFFYLTLVFEMLIAIFFTIFREDNTKIIFHLKQAS